MEAGEPWPIYSETLPVFKRGSRCDLVRCLKDAASAIRAARAELDICHGFFWRSAPIARAAVLDFEIIDEARNTVDVSLKTVVARHCNCTAGVDAGFLTICAQSRAYCACRQGH